MMDVGMRGWWFGFFFFSADSDCFLLYFCGFCLCVGDWVGLVGGDIGGVVCLAPFL